MTKNEPDIVGREVKDMYGTLVGKVLGTLTDIMAVFKLLV